MVLVNRMTALWRDHPNIAHPLQSDAPCIFSIPKPTPTSGWKELKKYNPKPSDTSHYKTETQEA